MSASIPRKGLNNKQWEKIKSLLPPEKPHTGRPNASHRRILNGILWILRTGAPWRDLPKRYGPWPTVYSRFRRWSKNGVWRKVLDALVEQADAVRCQMRFGATEIGFYAVNLVSSKPNALIFRRWVTDTLRNHEHWLMEAENFLVRHIERMDEMGIPDSLDSALSKLLRARFGSAVSLIPASGFFRNRQFQKFRFQKGAIGLSKKRMPKNWHVPGRPSGFIARRLQFFAWSPARNP